LYRILMFNLGLMKILLENYNQEEVAVTLLNQLLLKQYWQGIS